MGINAPPAPFVPEEHRFRPGCAVAVVGFGADEAHADALQRLRSSVPPLFEFTGPIPYVELQKLSDGANEWGTFAYEKSAFIDDLTDDAVAVFDRYLRTKPTPHCEIIVYLLGAGYADVADDATAFGGARRARYCPTIVGAAADAEELAVGRPGHEQQAGPVPREVDVDPPEAAADRGGAARHDDEPSVTVDELADLAHRRDHRVVVEELRVVDEQDEVGVSPTEPVIVGDPADGTVSENAPPPVASDAAFAVTEETLLSTLTRSVAVSGTRSYVVPV